MLEAKFADDSLSNFWRFKQIQGKSTTPWNEKSSMTTWRNKGTRKKNILLDATYLD